MTAETATANPVRMEIFIDFVCPWCYLAHGVVRQLREKHAVDVTWTPFPLHPDTPPQGLALSELFPGADVDAMHERLYTLMDEVGLDYDKARDHLFNTRQAQELATWAAGDEHEEALLAELFRAYFVENRNLADRAVLCAVAGRAGLDPEEAARVLDEGTHAADVDTAWDRARQHRISGVPAFVGGGYQFSGFQPLDEMERFLAFIQPKD